MKTLLAVAALLAAGVAGAATTVPAERDPAAVDITFGTDGVASVDAGATPDVTQGLIVGADYLYVLANGNTIVRFTPKGVVDQEFGVNGDGVLHFDDPNFTVTAVGEDPAGGLFIGGNRFGNVVVGRLNFDGTLDTDFGTDGFTRIDTPGNGLVTYLRFTQLKIVVVGTTATASGDFRDAFVAQLQTNGDPYQGWGFNGLVLVNFGTPCDEATYFSYDRNNNYVIAGDTSFQAANCAKNDIAFAKLNNGGERVSEFNGTGVATVDLGGVDRAGVVVNQSSTNAQAFSALSTDTDGVTSQVIGRITALGKLDKTFHTTGTIRDALPAIPAFTYNFTSGVQSDGRIVYAGDLADPSGGNVGVLRVDGSTQLSITDLANSVNDGDGTTVDPPLDVSSGGGAFGWMSVLLLGGLGLLRRRGAPRH